MNSFRIPSIPTTESKSIRFPVDLIQRVEKAIQGKNCTFSAFVIHAVEYALENLSEATPQNSQAESFEQ